MSEISAIYVIWLREVKRYVREKARVISSLAMPIFWIIIFGSGFSRFNIGMNVGYREFIFPGIVTMALLFTSIGSGVSVIWDREFGFLKEILVAPVSRTSILFGKMIGGSTVSVIQASILILLSFIVGIKLNFLIILRTLPLILLISMGLTALGLSIANFLEGHEGFQLIVNFIIMPMFLLSGALFPIEGLPAWLRNISLIDPVTYGVEALRWSILGTSNLPIGLSLGVLFIFMICMVIIGGIGFNRKK
ncbi:MAG: ABC transporter permease [Candidatus Parvarchaeota archaeon]|nr:ABC transporter permease [Candidatus Jingweiarchaeum tengchongense]MCW1298110.1 ABC transporter permease [Candidatus Jingweiarchaeum tengchongense]MCW1299910.1 ABC transporter permease [Candidatus Jingweiarchaeum tengchongense]MCW1305137.1 ABC transporter permease [Candidatus Jingweiarchaeum tengchongense]MCW1305532.1 ABC transporter permease [Candidatus Jingweiarchaeum tengchongense]